MQQYPSINGLRALSVFSVIIGHLNYSQSFLADWQEGESSFLNLLKFFLQDAQIGVNVFFILSGFLITRLLLDEQARSHEIALKNFYVRRALRIFPAYYFVLLVYFVLQIAGLLHFDMWSWITSVTFMKQFYITDWFTSHFWSLSVEEMFYLFWPFVFVTGDRWRKTVAISIVLLVPVMRVWLHFNPVETAEFTMFTRSDAIALGCLCALYQDKIVALLRPYWVPVFIFSAVALFVLRDVPVHLAKIGLGFIFIPLGVTHGTVANLLIALILMYSVFGPRGLWFWFLNTPVMRYIGVLSYSLYLWQQFFISSGRAWIGQFPQNVVLTFLAALGSYYLIEKPFLRLKSRFTTRIPAAEKTAVVEA